MMDYANDFLLRIAGKKSKMCVIFTNVLMTSIVMN
jgi:hypothetical protein